MTMSLKRLSQTNKSQPKRRKGENSVGASYLRDVLEKSGILINSPPNKCTTTLETIHIIRNIKNNLQNHPDYPSNVSDFYTNLQKHCEELNIFKYYLFPNIVRTTFDSCGEVNVSDSLIKILLSIPVLQPKLVDYVFEKGIDLASDGMCGPWIQMILKCFSTLDCLVDTEKICGHLINLLDIATEKMVRLEIIAAIPDIIGDQQHDNVATELSRILSDDHDLIPAILDCLSYLCLSDEQYEILQKKTLNILMCLSKCNYFPNFVKFLLMPRPGMADGKYIDIVHDLRNVLGWPTCIGKIDDLASSQVLTATAIRNSIIFSKSIGNAWMKVVSNSKESGDVKPIDFIILLILYSTSEEKQKNVENVLIKQIKLSILKEELLNDSFDKFQPILANNLRYLIDIANSLLKFKSNPAVQAFAAYIYSLMFSKLEGCRQNVIAELLQLGLDCKQCMLNILTILNTIATENISILKQQCVQMLNLLDRLDDMNLEEIRGTMNLLCCLAYSYENSVIRDDIHMIIRKQLSSSNPKIKIQGVISGIHAVKYLMATETEDSSNIELPNNISYSSINHLKEGDLREAAQVVELIGRSIRQFPEMIVFFYDELCKVVKPPNVINKHFLAWLTDALTSDLRTNFLCNNLGPQKINLELTMQHCLNSDSEIGEMFAVNIGGLVSEEKDDNNICFLPPLIQLVQTLHLRQFEGSLSSIDALLGCAVVMPVFDIDMVDGLDVSSINFILNCLFHCVNWFRELINGFATQNNPALTPKIYQRIEQVVHLETLIEKILTSTNIAYKPPSHTLNISKDSGEIKIPKSQSNRPKNHKQKNNDETMAETTVTQITQTHPIKNKIDITNNISFRPFDTTIINLLRHDLSESDEINDADEKLTIKILSYILKNLCIGARQILISNFNARSFLIKKDCQETLYDKNIALDYAKRIDELLPKLMNHLKLIVSQISSINLGEHSKDESRLMYSFKTENLLISVEYIFNFLNIYFKWIGFQHQNISLLKSSLQNILGLSNDNSLSLKQLVTSVCCEFQKHEQVCYQLTTAVALVELLKVFLKYSSNSEILKMIKNTASYFLSKQWKTPDGTLERGLLFNQSVDVLAKTFLINNEMLELKNLSNLLSKDIETLKNRNSTLNTYKCVNKGNFPVFYKNLGTALYEITKNRINKGLTNSEHIELWKNVTFVLKCMSDMSKTLDTRNNLSIFFKKSLPVIKLFLSHGIPILELEFKSETQEVLEIFKTLQQSTRFLQSLCCHSRLKKDNVLMSKVPYMRQLLETLIYKVKAALTANNCSEAFWMGNLKNKNIHGEVIVSQESVESEESLEDCDDQLPADDSSDTDNELNPDSKSLSDIV